MEEQRKIEDKLHRKEQEIIALEERLKAARVYAQALQDVLKMLAASNNVADVSTLKAGSTVAQGRDAILKAGKPLHIIALLEAMGRDTSRESRASLTSSLAAYVRRGEIFTRPAPNTFGLAELGHRTAESVGEDDGPPPEFGRVSPMEQRRPIPSDPPPPPPAGPRPAPPTSKPAPMPARPNLPSVEKDDDIPF